MAEMTDWVNYPPQDVIPADLYELILSEYEEAQASMEEELCIPV